MLQDKPECSHKETNISQRGKAQCAPVFTDPPPGGTQGLSQRRGHHQHIGNSRLLHASHTTTTGTGMGATLARPMVKTMASMAVTLCRGTVAPTPGIQQLDHKGNNNYMEPRTLSVDAERAETKL